MAITISKLSGDSINIITNGLSNSEQEKYMGPLCFTAQEYGATVGLTGTSGVGGLQISMDEQNSWTRWNGSEVNLSSECENGKLYVKALNPNIHGFYQNAHHAEFVINKRRVAASGNIQYLIDPTGERMDVPSNCYWKMFSNCTSLTSAPELPATDLAKKCYYYMFQGCTSLETTPELPATTLDDWCYHNMFSGCTYLIKAPSVLPATTLASGCYLSMFSDCTYLRNAPELPATTLVNMCYQDMFYGCTSLTSAPELPATTLDTDCYKGMFSNCNKITSVTMKSAANYNSSTHGYLGRDITINYV